MFPHPDGNDVERYDSHPGDRDEVGFPVNIRPDNRDRNRVHRVLFSQFRFHAASFSMFVQATIKAFISFLSDGFACPVDQAVERVRFPRPEDRAVALIERLPGFFYCLLKQVAFFRGMDVAEFPFRPPLDVTFASSLSASRVMVEGARWSDSPRVAGVIPGFAFTSIIMKAWEGDSPVAVNSSPAISDTSRASLLAVK